MSDEIRRINFGLTAKELALCNLWLMRSRIPTLVIASGIFGLILGFEAKSVEAGLTAGVLWGVAMLVLLPVFMIAKTMFSYKKNIKLMTNCDAIITPEKFISRSETAGVENSFHWKAVVGLERKANCLMVHVSKRPALAVCIPLRCFPTPGDADAFYNEAFSLWKSAHTSCGEIHQKNP